MPQQLLPVCCLLLKYSKFSQYNPLTPTGAMGTAIKHLVPDRVKQSFAIFDIWHFEPALTAERWLIKSNQLFL